MNLIQDNFYKSELRKVFKFKDREYQTGYNRYTYESGSIIYDVDIRQSDNNKTYHVNCGFETEPTAIHRQIEKHYNI